MFSKGSHAGIPLQDRTRQSSVEISKKSIEFGELMLKDMPKTTLKIHIKGEVKNSCKFYQKGCSQHKSDYELGSNFYKPICSMCVVQGNEYRHPSKDCSLPPSIKFKAKSQAMLLQLIQKVYLKITMLSVNQSL